MRIDSLTKAGLTTGEAKVYLALLSLGSSTSGRIIEKAQVSKSIVYHLLDKLMQKGLVSYILKEKTKHFEASDPKKLLEYLNERKKSVDESYDNIERMLPTFLLMQKEATPSIVKVFQGFKGAITVHEHMYEKLKRGEEYFYLGIPQKQPTYYHAYWQKDHLRRVKAGIKCRFLFHTKTDPKIVENRNSFRGCDARYMPFAINTPSWFMGYKDVGVIGFPSSSAITIEIVNKEIADSFRAYFEEFWKRSQKFKK